MRLPCYEHFSFPVSIPHPSSIRIYPPHDLSLFIFPLNRSIFCRRPHARLHGGRPGRGARACPPAGHHHLKQLHRRSKRAPPSVSERQQRVPQQTYQQLQHRKQPAQRAGSRQPGTVRRLQDAICGASEPHARVLSRPYRLGILGGARAGAEAEAGARPIWYRQWPRKLSQ